MTMALVTGAGGFIGGHLVRRLLNEGSTVAALDAKPVDEWWQVHDDAVNVRWDLTDPWPTYLPLDTSEVYHLAANMGGIGFIETHKLECALSTRIDLNAIDWAARRSPRPRLFYASSACIYPAGKQSAVNARPLRESDAYPADAEDGYGWQKLYTERLMRHVREDADIETRIGRFHNVYGPMGSWEGGREKAPAALCRKVAWAVLHGVDYIEVWGDGHQTRSFMHVDDCVEGVLRLMRSDVHEPLNIGSAELVTINQLARLVMDIAGVNLKVVFVPGSLGVRGRSSDNTLIRERLGWEPSIRLRDGMVDTYRWVHEQVEAHARF